MTSATTPCTIGQKHKWAWVKNIPQVTATTRTKRLALRGVYKCQCKKVKLGRPNYDGTDLRSLVSGAEQERNPK